VLADTEVSTAGLVVQIQPAGTFYFEVSFEVESTGAIQLELTAKGLSARCWLNIEEDLTSTDEERREKQAIRHILAGEFGDEDVFELLQILTRATQDTTHHRGSEKFAAVKPSKEMSPEESVQRFSYARWRDSNVRTSKTGLLGLYGVTTLKAFFKWLNKSGTEVAVPEGTSPLEKESGHRPAFKFVDDSETPPQSYDFSGSLREIIQAIPLVLSNNEKIEAAAILAIVSGAYALKLSLNSTWRDERAYKPLLSWLDEFSRFDYPEYGHEGLLKFALGAAAVVVGIARQYGSHQPVAVLKDNLLRFNLRWMEQKPTQEDLNSALSEEVFNHIPVLIRSAASASMLEIWNATSLDERIQVLANNAATPNYIATDDDEQEFPGCVVGIRRLLQVDRKRRYHGVVLNERQLETSGCPHCYQAFGDAIRVELRSKHLINCPNSNCKKPIFYFEDKSVQGHVMEVIKNA
jgi:hypothetical protein